MKQKSDQQKQIDREVAKVKRELLQENPICIFCLQKVFPIRCDPAHKIRRSQSSNKFSTFELQTMKKNIGLAHRDCHDTFDNNKELAKFFPGFKRVMQDIKEIDIDIYNQMIYL